MKNLFARSLSLFLAFVMVIGLLPTRSLWASAEEAAAAQALSAEPVQEEAESIVIDFKEAFKEASKQSFWNALPVAVMDDGTTASRVGLGYPNAESAVVKVAYEQLCTWLSEEKNWTFNESMCGFLEGNGNKIYMADRDDILWGLGHAAPYIDYTDGRSDLAIDVTVEHAGIYNLNIGLVLANEYSKDYSVDSYNDAGGGYADIMVNGDTVYEMCCFVGPTGKESRSMGAVQLREGVNTILLRTSGNYWGDTRYTGRSNVNLSSLSFTPLEELQLQQGSRKQIMLTETWLPFDTEVASLEAVSSDEEVVAAELDADGRLTVSALGIGDGEIMVRQNGKILCTIGVHVDAFAPSDAQLRGDGLVIDFKAFARQAAQQPWWDELAQVGTAMGGEARRVGNYYYQTMSQTEHEAYLQMKQWLSEHASWGFDSPHWDRNHMAGDRMYICAEDDVDWGISLNSFYIGMGEDSTFSVKVNAPTAGWYNLKLDVCRQNTDATDTVGDTGYVAGGAYIDIFMGDTLIADNYATKGSGCVRDSVGAVYLTEGENVISMEIVKSFGGTDSVNEPISYATRANVNLRAMELTPLTCLQVNEGQTKRFDLRTTFFGSGASVQDCTAVSEDESVAAASVQDGMLVLDGCTVGTAKVRIYVGEEEKYTFYVGVTENYGVQTSTDTITVAEDGWYRAKLTYEKSASGKTACVYLDDMLLGVVSALADRKLTDTQLLRPVYLTAGNYDISAQSEGVFSWSLLQLLPCEEPTLTLFAEALSDKQYRKMSTPILAQWDNGVGDDLTGAKWTVEVSDAAALQAQIAVDANTAPILQVTGLQPVENGWVKVTADVNGAESTLTVPVTVIEPAQLISADIGILCVDQGQIARLTTQKFTFDMLGSDGEVILPEEVEVTYETDRDGVIEIDAENHTFYAAAFGEVTVAVTVTQGENSFAERFDLTVAAEGENRLDAESAGFEGGSFGSWNGAQPEGTQGAFGWSQIADDGTGNMAMKVILNEDITPAQAGGRGVSWKLDDGTFAELAPGRIYEMSFRIKVQDLAKPEGAVRDLMLLPQIHDKMENAASSATIGQMQETMYIPIDQYGDQWTTVTLPVRAPISGSKVFYGMPQIALDCNFNTTTVDSLLAGWSGTIWFDDFCLREVAFAEVEVLLSAPLTEVGRPVTATLLPKTSAGSIIGTPLDVAKNGSNLSSDNEDVVRVVDGPKEVMQKYYGLSNYDYWYPTYTVELVGLNAVTQLAAEMTIGDALCRSTHTISVSDLPEILRDVELTLDGFDSVVLQPGETAQSAISGRTTQLNAVSEETIREEGAVYFVSNDRSVAAVDAVTGEVTCLGEGTAHITVYVNLSGTVVADSAVITVTDDTDLSSITIDSPVSYVTTGSMLQLSVLGQKDSGVKADMKKYPVAWSVDDSAMATIDQNGCLTGLAAGTVTVTACVGVMGKEVSASKQIIVEHDSKLPENDVILAFGDGRALDIHDATLHTHGWEMNKELTYNGGEDLDCGGRGLSLAVPAGGELVFDFTVDRSGWYRAYAQGPQISYLGGICDLFADESYLGYMDGAAGTTNDGAGGDMNTVWLKAGVHRLRVVPRSACTIMIRRVIFYAAKDPHDVTMTLMAEKTALIPGENTQLTLELSDSNRKSWWLLQQEAQPDHTNWFVLESSAPDVVSVSGMTLTAHKTGQAQITLTGKILEQTVSQTLLITVEEGSYAYSILSADKTTVLPNSQPIPLRLTTYNADGSEQPTVPSSVAVRYESGDTAVANVDDAGIVTLTGNTGSALIVATLTEGTRQTTAQLWINVNPAKTEPTVYTYEERANAQENVLKYDWAWQEKENVVRNADYYAEHVEEIYNMWIYDTFPRAICVGFRNEENYGAYCRYCGDYLADEYGVYPWIVDPIENPWKITCPSCKRDFPSNDFGAYYESGLDEKGIFREELADKSLLVNELYPEMGEGWGVDDGWGYKRVNEQGEEFCDTYIPHYIGLVMSGNGGNTEVAKHSLEKVIRTLYKAYLYTGEEKYGSTGAILIDRFADIFPGYDLSQYEYTKYHVQDGLSGRGKLIGITWDALISIDLARAVDVFWPAAENADVIEFLRNKAVERGEDPDMITPEYLRTKAEDNILREIYTATQSAWMDGNFGMSEAAVAYAAHALNRLPDSQEMIDFVFASENLTGSGKDFRVGGGDVARVLVDLFSRDGLAFEGSYAYNSIMEGYLLDLLDALDGFTLVDGADLWKNQKVVNLYTGHMRMTVCGRLTPQIHESGGPQSVNFIPNIGYMTTAFSKTNDPQIAKALYAANGNSTKGLHADIFTKDPESGFRSAIEKIVREEGRWDMSESDMLCGYGIAILREGPRDYLGVTNAHEFSDYWIGFGYSNIDHAQYESLNLDLEYHGLNLSSSMGYPTEVSGSSYERMQWVRNTVSHNTVVVDDAMQVPTDEAGFPLHFEDAGYAKVMDIQDNKAYDQTDIYRRTVIAVDNGEGDHYAVDFFRVLGGSEHVYSFHGATGIDPVLEGLNMTKQPFGTYQGADVPYGAWMAEGIDDPMLSTCSGYSWLDDVYRCDQPDTTFSVDWQIEDFRHRLPNSTGIHLKLTMLSEEPMTEVALANGYTPKKLGNEGIDHFEYMLVRRSGEEGMDSLFTSVIEPYQYQSYIRSSELVEMELVEGAEGVYDRAAAIRVTLTSGRVDYVIYATNASCTYEVDGLFRFTGFAGVVSYTNGNITYAWGNEATNVADVIEEADPCVTGTVLDFTKEITTDGYTLTIQMQDPVSSQELTGRWIYVETDGIENGVYRIYDADVNGDMAVLDLRHQTLVRNYLDKFDLSKGYRYNISEGANYIIPLSATFDVSALFTYTTDAVVRAGNKLNMTCGVAGSSVSYEAEGLAAGMKFIASNGQITWTPAKAQAGRYPITIKAIDADGDVIGEMSFVIYVVPYTGSTYAPDQCSHAKVVDFGTETVCPACGTITKKAVEDEEEIKKFDIAGSNMTLGNELKLNVLVNSADLGNGIYTAKISHNGAETEQTLAKYNSSYHYVTVTVAAKEMADVITVEIYDENGNAVSNVYETSVRSYAMNLLGNAAMSAKIKTLVVDMLNYGSEAQTYFKYNEADLANSKLTDVQKALATGEVTCTNRQVKGENFYGSNLSLEDRILLNLFFKNVTADMYAEISYTDYTGVVKTVKKSLVPYSGSIYKVIIDEIVLADTFSPVTVTVYNADGTIHGSGTDSVESYIARTGNSAINEAIMKFASSAKAYLS